MYSVILKGNNTSGPFPGTLTGSDVGDGNYQVGSPATCTIVLPFTLPIRLSGFTVSKSGRNALLKWTSQMKENSDRFEIERSQDSISYQEIVIVNASGNSLEEQSYQHTDNQVVAGTLYYRLRGMKYYPLPAGKSGKF